MYEELKGIVLIIVIYGSFILFAILKIKNGLKGMRAVDKPKSYRYLKKIDVIFSSIFLVFIVTFLLMGIFVYFQSNS